jgi:hypothetical protein
MVCQPIYCIGVIPIEKEGKNTTKKHGTFIAISVNLV